LYLLPIWLLAYKNFLEAVEKSPEILELVK